MRKFDHLTIPVADVARSRGWYVDALGLQVEFEVAERQTVAVQDSDGFHDLPATSPPPRSAERLCLYFRVADVDATFRDLAQRGVVFSHPPGKMYWGYGAELADPDGYLIRLWDEQSMKEK